MARTYGKMPHELLTLGLDEFNFSLAVMIYAANASKKKQSEEKENKGNMTPDEFEKIFDIEN